MRKILAIAAMLVCVGSSTAHAEKWIHYGSNEMFDGYFDYDTFALSDVGAEFWVKWEYTKKGRAAIAKKTKSKGVAYLKGKWGVICNNSEHPFPDEAVEKSNYIFDSKGGLLTKNTSVNQSYEIVPGTLMESMHSKMCSAVAAKDKSVLLEGLK